MTAADFEFAAKQAAQRDAEIAARKAVRQATREAHAKLNAETKRAREQRLAHKLSLTSKSAEPCIAVGKCACGWQIVKYGKSVSRLRAEVLSIHKGHIQFRQEQAK